MAMPLAGVVVGVVAAAAVVVGVEGRAVAVE
jgi:hypothetical protein